MKILKSKKLKEAVQVAGYRWLRDGVQLCTQSVEPHQSDTFMLVELTAAEGKDINLNNAVGLVDGMR